MGIYKNIIWNNKACQCECKNYHKCKKDYSCNPSSRICDNSKYLKSITDNSVIECDEIMDIVSTKRTNTIGTNVTKNCQTKRVRDCYILHQVLSAIILLLVVMI